jgi:gliding motility-associated-like protein
MKKKILLSIFIGCLSLSSIAAHITGGEMIYEYQGKGSGNSKIYKITLKLFRDNNCTNCAVMPATVIIGIFNGQATFGFFTVPQSTQFQVPVNSFPPCVQNPPALSYNVAFFELEVELPDNAIGYTATYQTCCRVNPLVNVFNTPTGSGTGATYSCSIPGGNSLTPTQNNSSPQFDMGISLICHGKGFTLNFSAVDPDGDQLVYNFCEAFAGGFASNANNVNPLPPPYNSVPYINGFSAGAPLGGQAIINSNTGIISGLAPANGKYVVCVCISEYRNGVLIGQHRKDFIVNVADCDFSGADLEPKYISCDGFTRGFHNLNTSSQNKTFFWDFGVTTQTNDTSVLAEPVFTYPDTGVYNLKLVINKGLACSDSTTSLVYVFPGFFPGFTNNGICSLFPVSFIDTTKTTYGKVDTWQWNFGDVTTTADTSHATNPSYTYGQTGPKQVQLIVSNSKGCMDTVYKDLPIIDKPPIQLAFRDTVICNVDPLQLQAGGNGQFTWTPATAIINENTPTPTVSPQATTMYYVSLNDNGCLNTDSVNVRVVNSVSLRANQDTISCMGDMVQLGGTTDGLRFSWSPSANIADATLLNTTANPITTTTFQLTSFIGSCSATDDMVVKVVPYPISNAVNDTTICFETAAQLNGQVTASTFNWSPAVTLINSNTLNPVAIPASNTAYVLTVSDNQGCPKLVSDTVVVNVLPDMHAFAGNDTAVISGQPLQLEASGGTDYVWTPAQFLSSPILFNPIANFSSEIDSIRYMVTVSNPQGCIDSAFINIVIFKTQPTVFIPTAFTPNGDGLNDILKPVMVGMKSMEYFRIYNRWGQLVFSTTTPGSGWDGNIGGKSQGTNSYVWIVKGIDYLNRPYFQKGMLTLIR